MNSKPTFFLLIVLCWAYIVSSSRAPDKAPVLPDGWCDLRYGTPTRTTGECICKTGECEGSGCKKQEGLVFYSGVSCPNCKCVPKKGNKENKAEEQENSRTNTEDAQRLSSYSTVKKAVKRVIPKSQDDSLDSYVEEVIDNAEYVPTWSEWVYENGNLLFAGLACLIFVPTLLAPALMAAGFFNEPIDVAMLDEAEQMYLKETAAREGVRKLKSGMLVEIIEETTIADALSPNSNDICDVTYNGTFKNGKRFDGGRTKFAPNQVIKGWTEAMQLMAEGDKWRLHIPYSLAYGKSGRPPVIPACSTLVFDIQIHKVLSGGKTTKQAREAFTEAEALAAAGTVEHADLDTTSK